MSQFAADASQRNSYARLAQLNSQQQTQGFYRSHQQSPRPSTNRKHFGYDGPETPDEAPRGQRSEEAAVDLQPSTRDTPDRTQVTQGNVRVSSPLARDARLQSQRRQSFLAYLDRHPAVVQKRTRKFNDGSKITNFKPAYQSSNGGRGAPSFEAGTPANDAAHFGLDSSSADLRSSAVDAEPVYVPSDPPVQIRRTQPPAAQSSASQPVFNRVAYTSVNSSASHNAPPPPRNVYTDPVYQSYNIPPAPAPSGSQYSSVDPGMLATYSAVDANSDGRIEWEELLSFLNASEARTGVVQSQSRRSSMGAGLNATSKVQRRLKLRRLFNQMDQNRDGSVSLLEFCYALNQNPDIKRFFDAPAWATLSAAVTDAN